MRIKYAVINWLPVTIMILSFPVLVLAEESSSKTPDIPRAMAVMTAQVAIQQGQIDKIRLPKNDSQAKELDQACLKGPRTFFAWMVKDQKEVPTDWKKFGAISKDPITYCHEQVAEYRKAQASPSTYIADTTSH